MNKIRAASKDDFMAVRALLVDSALVYEDLTPREPRHNCRHPNWQ